MARVHSRGYEFPNEGYVQLAIEKHFSTLGFQNDTDGDADLISVHPLTNERWVVEAKGSTAAIGLDFRTALGQLLQRIDETTDKYAIAVPNIPQFIRQCQLVSPWVRNKLNLYWLLIKKDGVVTIIGPDEELSS